MPVKAVRRTVTEDGQVKEDNVIISETPGGKVVAKEIAVPVNQAQQLADDIAAAANE
jgi:hypothetical protein